MGTTCTLIVMRIEATFRNGQLSLGFDEAGRQLLIETLQRIGLAQGNRHEHLSTEDWAGDELSIPHVSGDEVIVHQIDLGLLPER